jgi:hypothetical protein
MGLQKYRADESDAPDANGAVAHYARWMGGPTLAKIVNCPVARGVMPPRTVFITAEPDTYFSQPAACTYRGRTVRGFVTHIDGQWRFNPDRDSFASRRLTVEITYDTVSEDSLVDGATADNGFVTPLEDRASFASPRKRERERNISRARRGAFRWTLRYALDYLRRVDGDREPWEGQADGTSISVRVLGEHDPSNAAELQATYTLHLKGDGVSTGTWERLARLLAARGARFY